MLQLGGIPWDTPGTLAKLRADAAEAARQQVHLLVYPEALLGGYPKVLDCGALMIQRSRQGRSLFRRYVVGAFTNFAEIGDIINYQLRKDRG